MLQNFQTGLSADTPESCLREKLSAYYPAGIPPFAQERLDAELSCMSDSTEEALLLCRALSSAAARSGHILQPDGVAVGSFSVFLLTQSRVNPLPAHYYCTDCGHYETANAVTFGLDLPAKSCPVCKTPMRRDGFSIPVETVWHSDGTGCPPPEYRCSEGFFPFAYRTVRAFFAERGRTVVIMGAAASDHDLPRMEPAGIFILPEGKKPEEYPQFSSYLTDGTPCFSGDHFEINRCGIRRIILMPGSTADAIYRVQAHSGAFFADISTESLLSCTPHDLTSTMLTTFEERAALQASPSSFYEAACALTLPHNSYSNGSDPIPSLDMLRSAPFRACPLYCREDVFDRMVAEGADRERAAMAARAVRKGRATHSPVILEQLGVPGDVAATAAHCMYLFPRGFGAQRLVSLLLLARYMQDDPKGYFHAIRPLLTNA